MTFLRRSWRNLQAHWFVEVHRVTKQPFLMIEHSSLNLQPSASGFATFNDLQPSAPNVQPPTASFCTDLIGFAQYLCKKWLITLRHLTACSGWSLSPPQIDSLVHFSPQDAYLAVVTVKTNADATRDTTLRILIEVKSFE